MPGPLHGLTVLDLSTEVSGPFCTKLLADYGADVIKVEPPGGDPARRRGPFPDDAPHPERSPFFLYLNTNKRGVVLDLETGTGREAALRLAATADVVVENFAPGRMAALGLGWSVLRALNPALVLTSVTPFGQDGPYAGYAATNLTTYAMGGQMKMTGDPDREPLKAGGEQADYQAGLNAFAATAVAALGARRHGRGEHLDIGAMQCMASTLELTGPLWAYRGIDTSLRRGNVMSAAIGLYECADGYLGVHAMPRNWAPLAETMQMPELAEDERYRTGRARLEHNDELVAILTGWAADQEKKAIYERAGQMRGPIAYVHTMADLLTSPQLAARGYFRTVDHPATGPLTYPGPPFTMTASPARAGRAPLLDEHADEVFGRAGVREFRRSDTTPSQPTPARPHARTPTLPLHGIRILDLTMVWAGPYATRLLGDMGAEVIKVESVRFWDLLRQLHTLGPEAERGWNKSAYFNHNNRDKYAVSLDLTSDEGRALCLRLAAQCDVVIENYRADVLDRLGLSYEALRAVRSDIILVSMPGHGKDGPERDYVAYGTNVEQLAGLVSLTGYEGGPPHKSGISYGDPTAGIAAAGAVALALHHRHRTGEGQYVELAQRENLTALIGEHVVAYSLTGRPPERTGNRHPEWAPHDIYRCGSDERRTIEDDVPADGSAEADQWVAIACRSDAEFAALCDVIGQPDLAADPRFREQATRHAHQAALIGPITAWTLGRTHREAMAALQAAGIPAGAILSAPELFDDPHLRARGFWEQVAHPEAGVWDVDGVAWRLHDNPAHIRIPAPRFAEHNRYVLGDLLGLSAEEIAALEASGVAGTEPDTGVHQ